MRDICVNWHTQHQLNDLPTKASVSSYPEDYTRYQNDPYKTVNSVMTMLVSSQSLGHFSSRVIDELKTSMGDNNYDDITITQEKRAAEPI